MLIILIILSLNFVFNQYFPIFILKYYLEIVVLQVEDLENELELDEDVNETQDREHQHQTHLELEEEEVKEQSVELVPSDNEEQSHQGDLKKIKIIT